jgi:hypothetical protein
MAHRARDKEFGIAQVVLFRQLPAALDLVGGYHMTSKNVLQRAEMSLGVAVAVQAPFHDQRRRLTGDGHLVDSVMITRTADTLVDVNAVVEVDETRKVLNAPPANRLPGAIALADRGEHVAADPDLRMAVHACLGGRNASIAGYLDERMAIPAIDAEDTDMMLVTEWNGLDVGKSRAGTVSRTRVEDADP